MTEEQFWRSNPRIISVYEKIWKEECNRQNFLAHRYVGHYVLSALATALDGSFNGPKAKTKYIKEPFQLFELTEEEKKAKQQAAIAQFIAWADSTEKKYSKKYVVKGNDQ